MLGKLFNSGKETHSTHFIAYNTLSIPFCICMEILWDLNEMCGLDNKTRSLNKVLRDFKYFTWLYPRFYLKFQFVLLVQLRKA